MRTGYVRFPFGLYVKNKWSLEHIHAQNIEEIKRESDRKNILIEQIKWLKKIENNDVLKKIVDKLSSSENITLFTQNLNVDNIGTKLTEITIDDDIFKNMEETIFSSYSEQTDENNIHSIENLTLLSVKDNSILKNNIFPIKREKIIEMDKDGHFIPIATKNVFLKYFSKDPKDYLKWTKDDRKDYIEQLITTIWDFFNSENKIIGGKA